MSEEERDEQTPKREEPETPPPATWAGRERSGDKEAAADESSGLTDEFDGLEAELAAELAPEDDVAEAEPGADEPQPEEGGGGATIEADTLALADAEAAREAAHAGLKARTQTEAARRGLTTSSGGHPVVHSPVAKTAAPLDGNGEPPTDRTKWRFVAATFVIIAALASATSISFLLYLSDFAQGLGDGGRFDDLKPDLSAVEPGEPQTIMILGSDKRGGTPGDPGRSDTTLLLRVDPDKNFLALLSLPRDLKVQIPGYGTDRLNAAYSYGEQAKRNGGPELALKTVKELLDIPINHVVNVDFEGFYEAVNAIDCVYIDVDRKYFHSNEGLFGDQLYSEIDLPAGYSKLCGFTALQYVRYRHEDNDLVRGARQQDFVREARQRIPPAKLLPILGEGDELIEIFKRYTTSDIDDVATIIDMLETFVTVRNAEVRQLDLGEIVEDGGVEATPEQVKAVVDQFLGVGIEEVEAEPEVEVEPEPEKQPKPKDEKKEAPTEPAVSVIDSTGAAQAYSAQFEKALKRDKAKLPVYQPTAILSQSQILDHSRDFGLNGFDNKQVYYGYKFVMTYPESGFMSYYGVTGVNWLDPPILENPSESRNIEGREYLLFYQGNRLRLIGWKTDKGSYWVNNTLTHALEEDEMIEIATHVREYEG